MLIHPLLLQGVVALKALLLFTLAPTWHTTFNDGRFRHPAIGERAASAVLGFTLAGGYMFMYGNPIHLLDPPPPACTDLIVWQSFSDLFAARMPPGWIDPSELDWTVPGQPTLRAPEVEEVPSDVASFDLYFTTVGFAPKNSTHRDEKPFVPVVPDDAPPPGWLYEPTEQLLHRRVLRKGPVSAYVGRNKEFGIRLCRFVLLFLIFRELFVWLSPVPRYIKKFWVDIRRQRRHERRRRRLRERRRLRDR